MGFERAALAANRRKFPCGPLDDVVRHRREVEPTLFRTKPSGKAAFACQVGLERSAHGAAELRATSAGVVAPGDLHNTAMPTTAEAKEPTRTPTRTAAA